MADAQSDLKAMCEIIHDAERQMYIDKDCEKRTGFKTLEQAEEFGRVLQGTTEDVAEKLLERYNAGEDPAKLIAEGREKINQ